MTRRQFATGIAALVPSRAAISAHSRERPEGQELIGTPAPPLHLKEWLNSKPLEISDLHGKVALLRWWTAGCSYCAATGPALINLQQMYGSHGFQVIGIFHPKPPGKWTMGAVRGAAEEKQFTFPIAVDGDWAALKRWC